MLGNLSHKGKASEQAVEAYTKALQEDPWLWEAFTGLCDIGELSNAPPRVELITIPRFSASVRAHLSRPSCPCQIIFLPYLPTPNPLSKSHAAELGVRDAWYTTSTAQSTGPRG